MLTNAEGFAQSSNVYEMPILSYWKSRCKVANSPCERDRKFREVS